MPAEWVLEKLEKPDGSLGLLLGLKPEGSQQLVYIGPECSSLEQMQELVRETNRTLEAKLKEAEEIWRQAAQEQKEEAPDDPEQIWQRMQGMSETEMQEFFNSLQPQLRSQVAEHILTTANMFKGAGALFASRYDAGQVRMD
ncbi:MAG: hypothetical protein R6U22_02890 [Desulfohalobiaceae bacterium]